MNRKISRASATKVLINYIDADGDDTLRKILPRSVESASDGGSPVYLRAHCYKARAARTFRLDRIQAVADAGTGEVIELADWLRSFDLEKLPAAFPAEEVQSAVVPQAWSPRLALSQRWRAARGYLVAMLIGLAVGHWQVLPLLYEQVAGSPTNKWRVADDELRIVYSSLMARLPLVEQARLRAEERRWWRSRNAACGVEARNDCATAMTVERARVLKFRLD